MTDTAPASSPATDAAPTPATDPQLPGHPPVFPRLPGETPRAYSAFFLLGQAPTSSAQSPTASPSPRISANSASSNQISFSGHEKSQKVISQLSAGGPTPRHPAEYGCQPRREASQRTSTWVTISDLFQGFSSILNLLKPRNLFSHPTEKLFDIFVERSSNRATRARRRLGGTPIPRGPRPTFRVLLVFRGVTSPFAGVLSESCGKLR